MKEILDYLERERQKGLRIHEETDKLLMDGMASDEQEYDWAYYEGYADGMAAAINKISESMHSVVSNVVKELPVFKGYTVDERLREFRKMDVGVIPKFIPFDSPKGQELLSEYRKQKIHVDEYGEWTCLCGNVASEDGFFPCDADGNSVEPTPQEWTTNLYRCDRCLRKINQATGEIVA